MLKIEPRAVFPSDNYCLVIKRYFSALKLLVALHDYHWEIHTLATPIHCTCTCMI